VIVGSLLLILVAVLLLVLGLASGSSGLLIGSIAVSLLAAVALVVGARQAVGTRGGAGIGGDDEPFADDGPGLRGGAEEAGEARRWRAPTSTRMAPTDPRLTGAGRGGAPDPFDQSGPLLTEPVDAPIPAQATRSGTDSDDTGWRQPVGVSEASGSGPSSRGGADEVGVPADEPDPESVSEADAALVAGLVVDVYVVDGRPRYHLPDCPHLHGREAEPLPVNEAVELGFSPCGRCEPDSALVTDARTS